MKDTVQSESDLRKPYLQPRAWVGVKKAERAAVAVVRKWLRKGNMARCMRDILPRAGLSREERDRAARIVHEVVRWKRWLDFLLDFYSLDRTPENYVGAITGVLKVDRRRAERAIPPGKYTAIRLSFSDHLAPVVERHRWLADHLNAEPRTTLAVNLRRISREEAAAHLAEEGYMAEPYVPETALLTEPGARYSRLVADALAHVQDASSQLVARLVCSLGNEILDYCAGTGGKTLTMGYLRPDATIHAHDADESRLSSLARRAERAGTPVHIGLPDKPVEVVLVDAPCSGVGAARRNPEAKYASDTASYAELQAEILREAQRYVAPGGYLVYCVCTFTPVETYAVVRDFLRENEEFRAVEDPPKHTVRWGNGYLTALDEGDLLFVAILRRE